MPQMHNAEELKTFARYALAPSIKQDVLDPCMGQPRALLFVQLNHRNELFEYRTIFGSDSKDLLTKAKGQLPVSDGHCLLVIVHAAALVCSIESRDQRFVADLNAVLHQRGFLQVSHVWLRDEIQNQISQTWIARLIRALQGFLKRFLARVLRRLTGLFDVWKR